jgi:iron complex outermembrane recepter protein
MHFIHCAKLSAAHFIVFVLLACLLLPISLKAESNQKSAVQFHIPKQKLIPALTDFAEQSGVQLLYSSELAEPLSTSAINGTYAPQQALTFLLKGTGIAYHYVDKNIITLEHQAKDKNNDGTLLPVAQVAAHTNDNIGSDNALPKVTVEADSAYDSEYYTDPYNKDYVIPNAISGTKTDTPIRETPINVQVISKQVLKDQQVTSLDQALKNISGVTTNASAGNEGGFFGGTGQSVILR